MSPGNKNKGDDYYPIRWKFADFVENIIILHRTRAALAIAALGILLVLIGLFVLGWRPFGGDEVAGTDAPDTSEVVNVPAEHDGDEVPPEDPADPTTSIRPIATDQQAELTTPGIVIELGATVMRLTGGAANDAEADAFLGIATQLFPNREVFDSQLLSPTFENNGDIVIRVVEPTLFDAGTDDLNPELNSLIAEVATVVRSSGNQTVEVVGHADGGPLSLARAEAAADQIVASGVVANVVTASGVGNSEPVLDTPTERIDFVISGR